MNYKTIIFLVILSLSSVSCKKLVEIDSPVTKFDAEKVYLKDQTAIAVITSIYQQMSNEGIFQGTNSISLVLGVTSDELKDHSGAGLLANAYQNDYSSLDVPFWSRLYSLIYTTNTAITGINASTTLSPNVQKQLLGEAKFMRAFLYFYLTNLWGDIPLVLTNDYRNSASISKSSQPKVYQQIIEDLNEARTLLSSEYLLSDLKTPTSERIRPNKWTATALLARVYLYTKEFDKAESTASELITQAGLFDLAKLENVFLNDSKEAIWQIQAISPIWNTYEAKALILTSVPNEFQPTTISDQLIEAFDPGDKRKTEWVGVFEEASTFYNYVKKYKVIDEGAPKTEALVVFRLGEQYLIRAEARANRGDILGAVNDLNVIRKRARAAQTTTVPNPLPDLQNNITQEFLLKNIQHERRCELFAEWGHRWFDLKRTDQVHIVMNSVTPEKGGAWSNFKALLPIPQSELQYNNNIKQNQGY
jgi:hypothetical protein